MSYPPTTLRPYRHEASQTRLVVQVTTEFIMSRHLLRHVTVMAVAVGILTIVGVPWANALSIGFVAGCLLMAFGSGHSDHAGPDDRRETRTQTESAHRH